jgi:flagellar motor switch protein FliG
MTQTMMLGGPEKAALVLLSLGEDVASEVMKHLDEEQLGNLRETAHRLSRSQSMESVEQTFSEFEKAMSAPVGFASPDPQAYMRELAIRAFGAEKAAELFAEPVSKVEPLDAIRSARVSTLAELLEDEHPQVAAVIASQLPRSQAAQVMSAMSPKKQTELLGRIASLKEIPREIVQAASAALAKTLAASGALQQGSARRDFDGVSFAAGLLNELPSSDSERILNEMTERYGKVAPKIREAMFTFEDLLRVNARGISALMREVSSESLLVALKTASEGLRDHFLAAVSSRAAASMRDDLAVLPPMKLSEVENAQREIVEAALRLATDGRLVLPGGASEKLV